MNDSTGSRVEATLNLLDVLSHGLDYGRMETIVNAIVNVEKDIAKVMAEETYRIRSLRGKYIHQHKGKLRRQHALPDHYSHFLRENDV